MEVAGYEHRVNVDLGDLKQLVAEFKENEARDRKQQQRTFGELAADWLQRTALRRVCPENEQRHVRHVAPLLAELKEGELNKRAVEAALGALLKPKGKLSPQTVNKIRGTGRLIIRDAQGNGEWTGLNPFELVDRLPEPKPVHTRLTLHEAQRVLWTLAPLVVAYRLVKAAILLGARPGELFALQKTDVDLRRSTVIIRRSHGRNQTKTGKEREFPIPPDLVADLRAAIADSPSEYVFPKKNGKRRTRNDRISERFQVALGRAGVVSGYEFRCRLKAKSGMGCGYTDIRASKHAARCPRCDSKLYRTPIPKPIRFYDLRHAAATLYRKAGCDPLAIQLVLGHSATNTTDAHYSHLDEEYVRAELGKLKLGGKPTMKPKARRK